MIGAVELASLLGITYRQLDCWTKSLGVAKVEGSGRRRQYDPQAVAAVSAVATLVAFGFRPDYALDHVRTWFNLDATGVGV